MDTLLEKYNLPKLNEEEAEYTFFSKAYRTFSKTDHMIAQKTSLNKFKKMISSIFSEQRD